MLLPSCQKVRTVLYLRNVSQGTNIPCAESDLQSPPGVPELLGEGGGRDLASCIACWYEYTSLCDSQGMFRGDGGVMV